MTKSINTLGKTMFLGLGGVLAASFAMSSIASADTASTDYCNAVVAKYERYLGNNTGRSVQPQGIDARVAAEKCKTGDTSGVAALEKALENAKISLPPRT